MTDQEKLIFQLERQKKIEALIASKSHDKHAKKKLGECLQKIEELKAKLSVN